MKIIFWGTSSFAVPVLEKIARSADEVVGVITRKDKKQGRHLAIKPPPVKIAAQDLDLSVLQPEDITDKDFILQLKSLQPDIFVVVSYGNILNIDLLSIPHLYSINLHASLLPRYRGAAPINWAILNGEAKTGVTVIKMNEKMDAGDIIAQAAVDIADSDTAVSLGEKLKERGSDLIIETLGFINSGRVNFKAQNEKEATPAPLLKKEDGRISWSDTAASIHNKVRALQPWPGAWCQLNEIFVKLWKTKIINTDSGSKPGEVADINKEGIIISSGRGAVLIEELQLSSGRRMTAQNFVSGHCLKKGDFFR